MRTATVAELHELLRTRRDLRDAGLTDREVHAMVAAGELRLVRRGWFLHARDHSELWPESQHLAHVLAVMRDATGTAAASHESAAVLWGLPLYRHRSARVHLTTAPGARISSGRDVFRHVAELGSTDIVERYGVRCTSLRRTVFDCTRTLRVEASVALADAAERQIALAGRSWDEDAASRWRADLQVLVDSAGGARGIRHARWVLDFADGRAQLPGESVSRLQLVRLGFRPPRLQVPVAAPGGGRYFVDFGLDDVHAFGEFDGRGKYLDDALRRGVPLEQVLLEEKQREDWIRGTTDRRFARWGDEHIVTPAALGARLAAFTLRPPR